jgi:hypothetical protein
MILRTLNENDKALLTEWIAAEPVHASNTPSFYQEDGTKSVMYEDEEGAVFCVKYTPALVVDIEFNPNASRKRIRDIFTQGFPEVAANAKSQGFKQLVFASISERLIAFCRSLGFEASPDYRAVL